MPVAGKESSKSQSNSGTTAKIKKTESKDLNGKIVEIKGPESWWIAKSITISRVVSQSKGNPQRPQGVVD